MLSPQIVQQQLDRIGIGKMPLCKAELRQLPSLMIPGEEIEQLMGGKYRVGYAIIVATNFRLLVIDKTLGGGLVIEDIPYDMIAEVEFVHNPFGSTLVVFARSKKVEFKAYRGTPVRDFAQYLEQRMMETRNQIRTMQRPFFDNVPYQETPQYGTQAT